MQNIKLTSVVSFKLDKQDKVKDFVYDSKVPKANEFTFVKFPKPYSYVPMIWIWTKRIKGNSKFPIFMIPAIKVYKGEIYPPTTREGFWLQHSKFNKKNFEIHYDVYRDQHATGNISVDRFKAEL